MAFLIPNASALLTQLVNGRGLAPKYDLQQTNLFSVAESCSIHSGVWMESSIFVIVSMRRFLCMAPNIRRKTFKQPRVDLKETQYLLERVTPSAVVDAGPQVRCATSF